MDSLRRLSIASLGATFLLVTIGGLVRATKSGLGCGTDWPHCNSHLIPAFESSEVLIEYSHRLVAGGLVLLLAVLAFHALRSHRDDRRILWSSLAAFGLVLFQAVLGMVVVKLELEAESVVLHLVTAMALLATLVYLVALAVRRRGEPLAPTDRALGRQARLAAGAVLLLLMVGSYLSGVPDAGNAFGDWPLMGGRLVPDLGVEQFAVHFLHRALAAGVAVVVLVVGIRFVKRKQELPLQAKLAHSAMGLYAVEVAVGALNVWTGLAPVAVTLHLAVGALIWGCFVALAVVTDSSLAYAAARIPAQSPRGAEA
ncbi:MAG: COX15/CtaA family protein [Actinomycetota bacterium]